jgi:YVTN family beta-propeller protein
MHRFTSLVALAATSATLGVANAAPTIEATLTLGNQSPVLCTDIALAKAFVPNFADGTLTVIGLDSLTVAATVAVGQNPRQLVCNAATHRVYVVHATTPGPVTVVDASTNGVVTTIAVGNDSRAVGANFLIDELYISNFGSNTVSVISTATNTVLATLPVGTNPQGPASNDRLNKTYVASAVDGTVTVIDQRTRAVGRTIKVGSAPQYTAIDGQHGKVYVNNVTDHTVSVIDSATDTVVKTVPGGVGTSSSFGTVNALYRRYYLPNATDNTLTVIDTGTDAVVRTIPVGSTPVDVLIDGGTGNAYVANQGGDSVTIVNAATETVLGSFGVGDAPARVYESGDHLLVLNGNRNNRDSRTISTKQNTIVETEIATEFYHAGFDHYFHTASPTETQLLRDGLFDDNWHRTFEFWRIWTAPGAGRLPVCRLFSATFAPKSSHFYTLIASECAERVAGGDWQLEGTAAYYLAPIDSIGNCPAGTAPLYRVYNNSMSGVPNHRLAASRMLRDRMVTQGWIAEGGGVDVIFACTPTLAGG